MPDFDERPPIVLLSACSTSVRSDGSPTLADQLITRGTVTVLGAQVPVHVLAPDPPDAASMYGMCITIEPTKVEGG